jgi:hypothetical protein
VLLEVRDIALQAQSFEFAVRRDQQSPARSFIAATRLDSNKPIFYQVDSPDSVAATDFV